MKKAIKFIIVFAILYAPYYFYSKTNFEFDEAIHYSINDAKIDKIAPDDLLLFEDYPYEISDTVFVSNIEKKGFIKSKIDSTKNSKLQTILRFDLGIDIINYKCSPIYRDIIIFKTNNKITGIAKICFTCEQHHFLGNNFYDYNFNEYGDLKKLLYSK